MASRRYIAQGHDQETHRLGMVSVADGPIYAVSCRVCASRSGQRVETWEHALAVGAALPTLPLWISEARYVPLELERTYEDTCRCLRIP
jgi:hypothetical protein